MPKSVCLLKMEYGRKHNSGQRSRAFELFLEHSYANKIDQRTIDSKCEIGLFRAMGAAFAIKPKKTNRVATTCPLTEYRV